MSEKRANHGDVNDCAPSKKAKMCECSENLGEKINQLEEKLTKQQQSHSIVLDTLNAKVDKLIRLLSDLTENEAKLSKTLNSLTKSVEKQSEKPPVSAAKSVGVFIQNLNKASDKANGSPNVELVHKPPVDPLAEIRWGQNVYFLGDSLFNMLLSIEDVKEQIEKMKQNLQMTVRAKDKATIGSLYDRSRDKFIFAMPPKAKTIVLSIGYQDLFDETLTTLKEASLEEVKLKNRSRLKEKAGHVKAMIQKLIKSGKQVVYIIPATCIKRKEVFQHFEEIVLETFDLSFPDFKLLNLPELMRSTTSEFSSKEEHLKAWFGDLAKATLSDYGCRRVMEAMKKTIWSKYKKMGGDCWKNVDVHLLGPGEPAIPCPRCTKLHQGGPDNCRGLQRACKKCGLIGHFVDVHDVTDEEFRKVIVQTLGVDIYGDMAHLLVEQAQHALPIVDSAQLNDWYLSQATEEAE